MGVPSVLRNEVTMTLGPTRAEKGAAGLDKSRGVAEGAAHNRSLKSEY